MTLRRWAQVSDIHFPYHDRNMVTLFLKFIKDWKPDHIDLVGDIDDACALSKYSDGTASEHKDLTYTYAPIIQDFFRELRELCPNAEIVFHGGNHDIRVDHYISRKAPALEGLITPELLWKTDTYGIEYHSYVDPPVKRYGGYYSHHGIYAVKGAGNSVRKMVDDFGVSLITGHTHRQSIVAQTYELRKETLYGIELGNLCDLSSAGFNYTQLKDWQPGWGYSFIDESDNETVYPFLAQIHDNKTVVDGHLYSV